MKKILLLALLLFATPAEATTVYYEAEADSRMYGNYYKPETMNRAQDWFIGDGSFTAEVDFDTGHWIISGTFAEPGVEPTDPSYPEFFKQPLTIHLSQICPVEFFDSELRDFPILYQVTGRDFNFSNSRYVEFSADPLQLFIQGELTGQVDGHTLELGSAGWRFTAVPEPSPVLLTFLAALLTLAIPRSFSR